MSYDPMKRQGECPDDDACELSAIEITFAIPVLMTQDQKMRLMELISEITREPWNQPEGGVHWLFGNGAKPQYSQADQQFLGLPIDENAPASGEPSFDHSVYFMETAARSK